MNGLSTLGPVGALGRPASKSHMQRLVAAALLADGQSWTRNPPRRRLLAALSVAAGLGAEVEVGSNAVRIVGGLNPRSDTSTSVRADRGSMFSSWPPSMTVH